VRLINVVFIFKTG